MMKTFVLATENENKVSEFRLALKDTPFKIKSLKDLGLSLDVEEVGTTFEENAILKAKYISKFTKYPVIADDSGLELRALNGFPGINSHRFMEGSTYKEKGAALNEMLAPYSDKGARFVCAIALVGLNQFPDVFVGQVKGKLIEDATGEGGFGYDPFFYIPEKGKTMAELSPEEKNNLSHRAEAIKRFKEFLENL